ncbi:MAG: Lrp/AsnC family transcriptional regulator [Phycisphaerae bacterium]|nr:Lrp/AsnC family transcriptional regulator [Phycisphaerae bacterium]
MAMALSELERRLLAEIQHGLPATATPYKDVASKIGADIEDVLEILNNWKKDGRMRRVGAIVNHFKVGLQAGAMVVWQVEEDSIEEVGSILASFPEVSHAYERPSNDQWPYNVYTMVHGQGPDDVRDTIAKMSAKAGIKNYKQLETIRELKKVPPTYILASDR